MNNERCSVEDAVPGQAAILTQIALRSKAWWGYDVQFMQACETELKVTEAEISSPDSVFRVVCLGDRIAGFSALFPFDETTVELDALFVDPDFIRLGIGRLLFEDAIQCLCRFGRSNMSIQGDPNAAGFYEAMGAKQVGSRESGSIKGRYLPVFEYRCL